MGGGTAPINGATLTGNQEGASQTFTALVAAQQDGFAVGGFVSSFTIGTAYWIDAAVNATTAGTASITSLTVDAIEIL